VIPFGKLVVDEGRDDGFVFFAHKRPVSEKFLLDFIPIM
jgi:hypothetical protein